MHDWSTHRIVGPSLSDGRQDMSSGDHIEGRPNPRSDLSSFGLGTARRQREQPETRMSGSINSAEVTRLQRVASAFLHGLLPACIALAGWLAVLWTNDGVGESPAAPGGPGLTVDEIFNIDSGVSQWRSLVNEGSALWTLDRAKQVFGHRSYNPDHPPLGRLAIGLAHDLGWTLTPRNQADVPYSLLAARTAPATAFALTVLLVGFVTSRWYGPLAGTIASVSLMLMPRVFGHAHFAALETFVGFFFTATVLYVASFWNPDRAKTAPPRPRPAMPWKAVLLGGVLFGLTLLTKIQAVLLPIPIGLWSLWHWRWRAIPMMLLFGVTGLLVFFVGWPWLWLDPVAHFGEYLGRSTDRISLDCYYLGQEYTDRNVPWHYPFVMFAVTVPVLLHGLGIWGSWHLCRGAQGSEKPVQTEKARLVFHTCLFPLIFFAIPGITVYDGVRLFLVSYPLWAVLIGLGGSCLFQALTARTKTWIASTLLTMLLASQSAGLFLMTPAWLSYYNAMTGGLYGANSLGMEPTFWRDSITRDLLEEMVESLPPGTTVYLAPVLHPANQWDLELLSPLLKEHGLRMDAYDDQDPSKSMRYVLVYRRHADSWDKLEPEPPGAKRLAEVRRCGVQLAALYDLDPAP